jgi:hypothetical protein
MLTVENSSNGEGEATQDDDPGLQVGRETVLNSAISLQRLNGYSNDPMRSRTAKAPQDGFVLR